jgi:glycosyltransferase involved in cell wall biosynthesis
MAAVTPDQPLAQPSVSVIIIFLDAVAYLDEAIESVLAQSLTDWELLLVDDGSSDGSSELAQRYVRMRAGQITYLAHPSQQNLGMSASRNLGLHNARGRLVAFLDADDVYLPERLQRHVEILDRIAGIDMVQSELIHWYSWESIKQRRDDDYVRPFLGVGDCILDPPQGLMLAIAVPLYSAGICNITVRTRVAIALGGFEPQFRAMYEDQVFLSKLYLNNATYVLQAYLARYRRHSRSWVRRAKESGSFVDGMSNPETQSFYAWLCNYASAQRASHPLLLELLAPLQATLSRRRTRSGPMSAPRFVAIAKRLLPALLPRAIHRRLLHWNRAREFSHARAQYEALCARLSRYHLGKAEPRAG